MSTRQRRNKKVRRQQRQSLKYGRTAKPTHKLKSGRTGTAHSKKLRSRKMPRAKYKQRFDGEGFEVESGKVHRIACCDCGLVHDFVFVSADGKPIGIAAEVNRRSTAQKRRHMTPNTEAHAENARVEREVGRGD